MLLPQSQWEVHRGICLRIRDLRSVQSQELVSFKLVNPAHRSWHWQYPQPHLLVGEVVGDLAGLRDPRQGQLVRASRHLAVEELKEW